MAEVFIELVSGLQEAGMNPVADVEATSGGDRFVITVDADDEPDQA
jgi:hypothetical protein